MAAAGTDAMANYALLRGPVGMNRVFIAIVGETTPEKLHSDLKQGRTFVTNGPLLGLEIDGKHPGDDITFAAADAAYFVSWFDRVITGATARSDYNNPQKKQTILQYLNAARTVFQTPTETIGSEE
jgi:hypothetical protein